MVPKTIASIPEPIDPERTSGKCPKRLDRALTRPETTGDRELDRLVAAWPRLPKHVRRAILILADNCG
jgi:hypothetical protein